ncbi:MAG TPA: hypothetical protein VMT67_02545 [Terriglobales bacterium]|nr:hypothetical protein [Terriglobales bacterium]
MKVTVEIGPLWTKMRSPIYPIVTALTGVSVSFAPLFLYWSGKGQFYPRYTRIIVPLCFALIFFVPFFYIRLGGAVARELRKRPD